jgi:membrane associated rhomboid family serine protease
MPRRGFDEPGSAGPQLAFPRLTPAVKAMLIGTVALLVVELVVEKWMEKDWFALLALWPRGVLERHQYWRILTWPLLQSAGLASDLQNTLWACVGLYFFGTDLEESFGTRRFLLFTGIVVAISGIVATLYGLVHSVYYTQPVYGVAPLGYALTAAWGNRFPHKRLFFPPVSARVFVWILLGLAVLYILARSTHESPAASLGAIAVGWFLGRYWDRIDDFLDRRRVASLKKKRERILRGIPGGGTVTPIDSAKRRPADKRYLN